jgi:hypothetical protein
MKYFLFIVSLVVLAASALAGGFRLREENDAFAPDNHDHCYTQGLQLDYVGDAEKNSNGDVVRHLYGLRNVFYTPSDKSIVTNQPDDRPWAGLTALSYTTWERSGKEFVRSEWLFGVVGEWSYSEQIQTYFHHIIGSGKPMGWSNQIPNEVVANYTTERYHPVWMVGNYDGWGSDLAGVYGGALGTAFVYSEVGLMLRAGWNLPKDYRSGVIIPTAIRESPWSAYIFAGASEKLMLHNVMLGGSFFQDGPKQDLRPLVADGTVGASVGYGGFELAYALDYRSREFYGQEDIEHFGSITISYMRGF